MPPSKSTARRTENISANRERDIQLRKSGAAGNDVLDLLEIQQSREYYKVPTENIADLPPWESSKKVLHINLTEGACYGLDVFPEIKQLATIGLPTKEPRGVLYAVLTVANPLYPAEAPLKMACTLRLGGVITGDEENIGNCYELIEFAVQIFEYRRKRNYSTTEDFTFRFHGDSYYFTVSKLTAEKSLLVVFNWDGIERIQAVV